MKRSTTRLSRLVQVLAGLVVFCILWAIFLPVYSSGGPSVVSRCISNVKLHSLSMIMYAGDFDDHFPLAHDWYTVTATYRRNGELWCPEIQKEHPKALGYAYDSRLHGVSLKEVAEPAKHPMVFESTSLAENTADPFTSLPIPGRHKGNNSVGYMDGHAKSIPMKSEAR